MNIHAVIVIIIVYYPNKETHINIKCRSCDSFSVKHIIAKLNIKIRIQIFNEKKNNNNNQYSIFTFT
jgi:hypothetical protein